MKLPKQKYKLGQELILVSMRKFNSGEIVYRLNPWHNVGGIKVMVAGICLNFEKGAEQPSYGYIINAIETTRINKCYPVGTCHGDNYCSDYNTYGNVIFETIDEAREFVEQENKKTGKSWND